MEIKRHIYCPKIPNQYGYSANICKYKDGELVSGFTLHTFGDVRARDQYAKDLSKILDLPIVSETFEGI